ncbi:hypothetical protein [Cellvibrio sp. UBA7661]|uniref:hypothetical protein n=1 Tax=Cellvibrio sp. UBA7661 TaxID=1946311 RepID=UPI002F35E0DB
MEELRILFFISIGILSFNASAENSLVGVYSVTSERTLGLYGTIKVTQSEIQWTAEKNKFICSANYKIIDHGIAKTVPDQDYPIENKDGASYEYYRISLSNKDCPYAELLNGHVSERTEYFQFVFPVISDKYNFMQVYSFDSESRFTGRTPYVKSEL